MDNEHMTPPSGNDKQSNQDDKAIVILSYLFLLFLVPLLIKKDSPFAQYHAKQGLLLAICWLLAPITLFLAPFVYIFCSVMAIIGIMNVLNEKMVPLPLIGQLAEKFKI